MFLLLFLIQWVKFVNHRVNHRTKLYKVLQNRPSKKVRKKHRIFKIRYFFGGDKRDRTADLLNAIQ